MEIVVENDKRRVEIWLTRAEKENVAFCESLAPIFVWCKSMNYVVAVFNSGEKDLFVNTCDLLLYNRDLIVKFT